MPRGTRIIAAVAVAFSCALPAAAVAAPVSDPLLDQQWALARESVLGRAAAWQQSTGGGALVAVLDTGANFAHPDLAGAFWVNPAEIAGNRVDDDRNGYVDDVHGVDLVNDDGDPSDDEGHGTHVAGIIAARAGNAVGGAGLAPDARLMIVKVLDERRGGTAAGLADGIRYAVAHGAKIINTSVNGDGTSRSLQDAIRAAGAAGALVVASSGNDGRSIDLTPSYPASYTDPSIVSVGSIGVSGRWSSFSNRGLLAVDIAAPGEDVLSTARDNGFELRSGTSMSTPYVSATLALVQSVRPDLEGSGLKAALLSGASPASLLTGDVVAGVLDAAGSLRAVVGPTEWQGSPEPLTLGALRATRATRGAVLSWALDGDHAAVATVKVTVGTRTVTQRSAAAADSVRVRAKAGLHRWRVVALDAAGTVLGEAAGAFRVRKADWPSSRRAKSAKRS